MNGGSSVGGLIVRLLLERDKFRADLRETVGDAEAGASRVARAAGAITEAVSDAAQGQANVASLAARSLGLLGPAAGVAVAGAIAVGVAYYQAGKEVEAFHRNIILTGNAAGVTAAQLQDMARRVDGVAGTHSQAAATLAQMTGTAQVVRQNLELVTTAAVEMERASVQSVSESVKIFTDLGKDPVKASIQLNESLNYLTASTYEQIKAAQDLGDKERAASIAQTAYAESMRERTAQVEQNLGILERSWRKVRDIAAEAWDAMLDVGRQDTAQDKLAQTRARINELQAKLANGDGFGETGGGAAVGRPNAAARNRLQAELSALQAQEAALQGVAHAAQAAADVERERAENNRLYLEWDQQGDAFKQKADKQREERRKAEAEGQRLIAAGLITEVDLRERLAGIDKKYEDKGASRSAAAALQKEQAAYQGLMASIQAKVKAGEAELAQAGAVTESQRLLIQLDTDLAQGKVKLTAEHEKAVRAAIDDLAQVERRRVALAAEKRVDEERLQIQQELNAAYVAESKAREQARQAVTNYVAQNSQAAKALEYEISLMGLSRTEREAAIEQYRIELDLKQRIADIDSNGAFNEAQREAERARLRVSAAQAVETAGRRVMLDEWKQTVDQYDQVFQRGFVDMMNAGKDGWKSFTRSLATTFKTTVADTLYKAFAQPFVVRIVGQLLGLFGGGGGGFAQAAAGGASALGTASNAFSLYNAGSQAWTLGSQFFGGTMSGANALGTLWANGTGGGLDALLATNGAYGTAGAGGLGMPGLAGGGIFAGAAALVLNALGAFRSERRVGGGLSGTLGGDISAWEEWREGGTLFSGPSYSRFDPVAELRKARARLQELRDSGQGDTQQAYTQQTIVDNLEAQYGDLEESIRAQAKALNDVFDAMRTSVGDMADALGIDSEAVRQHTVALGGKNGLNFEGLRDDEIQAKISEALASANNELAQQVIGHWETVTYQVGRTVSENIGSAGEDAQIVFSEVQDTITETRYVASEYAREGEKAIDTLTRLATSLTTVNGVFEILGVSLFEASLAGADVASQLVDLFGSKENFTSATSSYFQNFYTTEEQREAQRRALQAQLDTVDLELPDIDAKDARAKWRALAEAQDLTTESGRAAWAMLMQLSGAFAALTDEVEDATAAAEAERDARRQRLEDLYGQLDRAIRAENAALQVRREVLAEEISVLSQRSGILRSNELGILGGVESSQAWLASQGRAFIDQALQTARASGYLPDNDALTEAINAARAGLDAEGTYATDFERRFDARVLANQIGELGGINDEQLSTAERTLRGVDELIEQNEKVLEHWRELIDAALGNTAAVVTVQEAIAALHEALAPKQDKPGTAGGGAGGASGGAVWGPGGTGTPSGSAKYSRPGSYTGGTFYTPVSLEEEKHLDKFYDLYHSFDGTGDLEGLMSAMKDAGATYKDLEALSGLYARDWHNAGASVGVQLPSFAVGTNYVNEDMVAQIHKGEAILPEAFNPWAGGIGLGDGQAVAVLSEILLETRAVRDKVAELLAPIVDAALHTSVLPNYVSLREDVAADGQTDRVSIANVDALGQAIAEQLAPLLGG